MKPRRSSSRRSMPKGAASALSKLVTSVLALPLATCGDPTDICTPQEASFGFFSKGDCVLSRAGFFQGHEWITYFGNLDLPADDRFTEAEIRAIAEGNRRVDWPKELLVHLNSSLVAYVSALTEYTERPEVQRLHFLLDDRNDSAEAAADAHEALHEMTREAISSWNLHRARALSFVGKACHVLQDSFSSAHTQREPEPGGVFPSLSEDERMRALRCVRRVKAFTPRAPGHDRYADGVPVLFHGGPEHGLTDDGIGHTSTEDSIYREGRDCHNPQGPSGVEGCLRFEAQRARLATRDYLGAVRRLIRAARSPGDVDEALDTELDAFIANHLSMCQP